MGTTILSPMFGHFQKGLWQKRMAKVDAFQGASCICWYHSSAALKFWVLHAIDRGQLQISFTKEDVSQFDGAHRLFLIFGPAVTLDTGRILGIPQSKVSIFNRKLNTPQIKIWSCEICFGNTCTIMELKKALPGPTQTRPFKQVCEAQNRLSGATVAFAWPQICSERWKLTHQQAELGMFWEIWTPFLE